MLLRLGVAGLMIAAFVSVMTAQVSAQDTEVIVPIEELNGSGVSGDATLTDNGDGTTTIDVLVDGSTGGHPIHLHSGTCANLGDVLVTLADVDENGVSVTDVDIPLAEIQNPGEPEDPANPYINNRAINIHLSAEEISTYVACGDVPTTDVAATGGETTTDTTTTTTPATGVGSTVEGSSNTLALMGMVAAAIVFFAGMSLRRSEKRI
jgi:hypothetical protein